MPHAADAPTDPAEPIIVIARGDPGWDTPLPRITLDLSKFPSGRWALQLDKGLAQREAPVVIVAHGLACRAVAWWAQLSPRSYVRAVSGALFHAPLQARDEQHAVVAALRSGPCYRLPFASIVLGDAWHAVEETLALADRWGSRFVATGSHEAAPSPSNRHAPLGPVERALLAHIGLFDPFLTTPPSRAVGTPVTGAPPG
ncbi:alpha/beta hydrolase [Sphingomonas sp. PAMC 26605]|uniref:alpha/beta hydrolase n=1 Tax=Sphingomonas sp. PAMC 26605 TaxID=1112214 RepID=UPI00026CDDBF|nr:alpha/beta hydrolase [Sphingomonas sp. PAMC 26605]